MKSAGRKISSPSIGLVIFGLVTAYISVCGLTSLWLGTEALIVSVLILLLEVAIAAEAFDLRHPSMPWFLIIWIFSVGLAASIGVGNYHATYGPYKTATSGRFYDNVGRDAKAAVLMDAGVVDFDSTMVLDDTLSVGLTLGGVTYCAAPIVSSDASQLAGAEGDAGKAPVLGSSSMAVQFWATGRDCCGSRGGFVCDNAGEAGAKSGIVWLDPSAWQQPSVEHTRFMQVIQASCALHDLQSVPQPLLVHWVHSPRNVLLGMFTRSLLVWIVSSIVYGVAISAIVALTNYYFDMGVRSPVEEYPGAMPHRYGNDPFATHSKLQAPPEASPAEPPKTSVRMWLTSAFKSKGADDAA
mmetsp:Transcript_87578/g.252890  ORF Transcript_87578/g.252890 Transcript_87578/m.252890 type:complete len:354 (+) Transcript_87578:76-1137(+)|eukprot:CAMPEP_0176027800 /NCGR_PEP_ID=MMETSP0120_2-20121206/13637_1 /TAXON_ID=160619 /ORGANISM="Kryptoperidinium foliaceum, Strain CCMP 1326" /LENGTH=353 /DNA_ID=CAMNT_0017361007 /DNA_START=24 /DNA_END=1085 /DNA_ORIENTATION=+